MGPSIDVGALNNRMPMGHRIFTTTRGPYCNMAESPSSDADRSKPTREEYQVRLDRITSIFSEMVQHADEVSLTRCPYKNRHNNCTAQFGCRFQDRSGETDVIGCKSDDKLDYRTAWETDPDAADRMHTTLRSNRTS